MKWVSMDNDNPEKYHTQRDCPFFPESVRELQEDDLRRGIGHCQHCKGNGTKMASWIRNHEWD